MEWIVAPLSLPRPVVASLLCLLLCSIRARVQDACLLRLALAETRAERRGKCSGDPPSSETTVHRHSQPSGWAAGWPAGGRREGQESRGDGTELWRGQASAQWAGPTAGDVHRPSQPDLCSGRASRTRMLTPHKNREESNLIRLADIPTLCCLLHSLAAPPLHLASALPSSFPAPLFSSVMPGKKNKSSSGAGASGDSVAPSLALPASLTDLPVSWDDASFSRATIDPAVSLPLEPYNEAAELRAVRGAALHELLAEDEASSAAYSAELARLSSRLSSHTSSTTDMVTYLEAEIRRKDLMGKRMARQLEDMHRTHTDDLQALAKHANQTAKYMERIFMDKEKQMMDANTKLEEQVSKQARGREHAADGDR